MKIKMGTEKIKPRKKESSIFSEVERGNKIQNKLNSCFEKHSIDLKDHETILDWACYGFNKRELIYQLERKKQEVFKQNGK